MNRIARIVAALRHQYGTGGPFELCDKMNIGVYFQELTENIKGFYFAMEAWNKRLPVIIINSSLDRRQQCVVCAHELGHCILHPSLNYLFLTEKTLFSVNKLEREANMFCAWLLLDDELLGSFDREHVTVENIVQMTGIPAEIIELRFGS